MAILVSNPEYSRIQHHLGNERFETIIQGTSKLSEQQCLALSNSLSVFEQILKLKMGYKQKTIHYDPSKKIRFNPSIIPNLEIWLSYSPDSSIYSKDYAHSRLVEVTQKLNELFPEGALRNALIEYTKDKPQFISEAHWGVSLKQLQSDIITKAWFLGKKLDFPSMFPKARRKARAVHIFAGETSSGKTYQSLLRLKKATSGAYVGPLRLNALEVYDDLMGEGIVCDLLTGEEKLVNEGATHQSSTVELMPFRKELECVVIDEAQLMDDSERGHSFVSAILGACAKEICITCPPWAVDKIKALFEMLGDSVEVTLLERKTQLITTDHPMYELPTLKGTAIVAFSRKRLFQIRKTLPSELKVSILYGGMPPQVRREQARRFREGETTVLLATDCIALGLNLPILHIVLDSVEKFDGTETRLIYQAELLQIVGRAGRYGIYEIGYVSGTSLKDHLYIERMLQDENHTVMLSKYYAAVPFDFIHQFMSATGINRISEAMSVIYENLCYDNAVYDLTCINVIMDNLCHIEQHAPSLELSEIWSIAHIPIDITTCEATFNECLYVMVGIEKVLSLEESILSLPTGYQDTLFELERLFAQMDCVQWFYNRYPEYFEQCIDPVSLNDLRQKAEKKMNDSVATLK